MLQPRSSSSTLGAAALAVLIAAGCDTPAGPESASQSLLGPGEPALSSSIHATTARDDLLKAVRQATSRYNSPNQAIRAGYDPDDHCVAVEGLGGMGYHWANVSLVDPFFDPLKPEVMLYATGPGGNLRLVAVEYIVIDVGQDHPHFGDHPFDIGGTPIPVDHWSLHVWLYEQNPLGTFEPFNPNVSCP
jgi:hypothetical protein